MAVLVKINNGHRVGNQLLFALAQRLRKFGMAWPFSKSTMGCALRPLVLT